jgi:hypothetical protein
MKTTISSRHMFGSGMLVLVLAGILGTAMWIWQDLRFELWNREERDLEGLQVFGTLPGFSLVERSGRRIGLADLRGKVWIARLGFADTTRATTKKPSGAFDGTPGRSSGRTAHDTAAARRGNKGRTVEAQGEDLLRKSPLTCPLPSMGEREKGEGRFRGARVGWGP